MAKLETCGEKGLAQQGSKDALLEELEDFFAGKRGTALVYGGRGCGAFQAG